MTPKGCLYFVSIVGGGPVKVGYTSNVNARLTTLAAWCPYPLELLHSMTAAPIAETYCLEQLRPYQMKGEWHHPHPKVLEFVARVKAEGAIDGCPDHWPHQYRGNVPRYDRLIPLIWPDKKAMAREIFVLPTALPLMGRSFSNAQICRIITAVRKRGVELKTADLMDEWPKSEQPPSRPWRERKWTRRNEPKPRMSFRERFPEAFAEPSDQDTTPPTQARAS